MAWARAHMAAYCSRDGRCMGAGCLLGRLAGGALPPQPPGNVPDVYVAFCLFGSFRIPKVIGAAKHVRFVSHRPKV